MDNMFLEKSEEEVVSKQLVWNIISSSVCLAICVFFFVFTFLMGKPGIGILLFYVVGVSLNGAWLGYEINEYKKYKRDIMFLSSLKQMLNEIDNIIANAENSPFKEFENEN